MATKPHIESDHTPRAHRTAERDLELIDDWILFGAYVEQIVPRGVSLEELGRVEDAAAERFFQHSRRDQLPAMSSRQFPGRRKRSSAP